MKERSERPFGFQKAGCQTQTARTQMEHCPIGVGVHPNRIGMTAYGATLANIRTDRLGTVRLGWAAGSCKRKGPG
jgi:hypothetical protein